MGAEADPDEAKRSLEELKRLASLELQQLQRIPALIQRRYGSTSVICQCTMDNLDSCAGAGRERLGTIGSGDRATAHRHNRVHVRLDCV